MSEKIKSCACIKPRMLMESTDFPSRGLRCRLSCEQCGRAGPWETDMDGAVEAWNHRPREERLEKLLREAKDSFNECARLVACGEQYGVESVAERASAAIEAELEERP